MTTTTIADPDAQAAEIADSLMPLPYENRITRLRNILPRLSEDIAGRLSYAWELWARPDQLPPPEPWSTWLVLAGRGFGKTRVGSEWIRARVSSGRARRIALVAKSPHEADNIMVRGESGILAASPPWERPHWEPSKRQLTWPNGSIAHVFSAYEPNQLRGPQFDTAWCDELAAWEYLEDTWNNLAFALRLGPDPRRLITTTPKPIAILRDLITQPEVRATGGATYDNDSNLDPAFINSIRARYEGARAGLQEIHAHILEESEDALWRRDWIEEARVQQAPDDLNFIVIAIDPAVSTNPKSAETGIIVAGSAIGCDEDPRAYVLADESGRYTPKAWAEKAIELFHQYEANIIIGEANNGGDLIMQTLRSTPGGDRVPYTHVRATLSKRVRAEPVSSRYEQRKVHHVGAFPQLEDQLCTWSRDSHQSPDRLDALVWAIHHLTNRPTLRIY